LNQQQNPDNVGFLYFVIILVALTLSLWWLGREWLVMPVVWLRIQECNVAYWFFLGLNKVTSLWGWNLHHVALSIQSYSINLEPFLSKSTAHKIAFHDFNQINNTVGSYVRYVVITVLLYLCYKIFTSSKIANYRITHTMKSLKSAEVTNWPQIRPVLGVDLVKADLNKGPWAMAQSPLGFCKRHKLVHRIEKSGYPVWGLHRDLAKRLLISQVGRQINNVERLPIHVKGLLVIFIARACRKRKVSDHFIEQFASTSGNFKKIDFSGVEEQLQKLKKERCVSWVMQRHAYVYSFMATMLEIARSDGVLASSEFLWLKPVDRQLWFMLNSVGRQTAVVEIAGGVAHWLAEKKVGRALKTPMIKEAVNALQSALENMLCEEEGSSWRSKEA
jgi:intracellular multiplication protein IcmP